MSKILEPEFRKELYKNLIDAGYDKEESQKIVGTKYYKELHDSITHEVDSFLDDIVKEKFEMSPDFEAIMKNIDELKKLKEIIG